MKSNGRLDKEFLSEDTIKRSLRARRDIGLTTLTMKDRDCLRCDKSFFSYGPQHRMCSDCRQNQETGEALSVIFR